MANLESILAETNKAYDQSRNALNNQINAIAGDLEAQKNRINAQYAQQGKSLDDQRNWQAQASSMAASRNGGSFGGAAEIANKKYYQQAYVPAVTQMQTNQANDLSSAESQANQNRMSLQQALAQLNDEANKAALQRYDAAVQAEREEAYRQKQLALQRQQLAAQNSYQKYLMNQNQAQKYKNWNFGGGYSVQEMPNGQAQYLKNGNIVSAGEFLEAVAPSGKWNTWKDIWANGVSTKGVGSDTIAYYSKLKSVSPTYAQDIAKIRDNAKYSYLYR